MYWQNLGCFKISLNAIKIQISMISTKTKRDRNKASKIFLLMNHEIFNENSLGIDK